MEEKTNTILSKLYNGELNPRFRYPNEEEFLKLKEYKKELSKELVKDLNESKRNIFYEYVEIESQLNSIDCENQFLLGFKLATKIICAGLE